MGQKPSYDNLDHLRPYLLRAFRTRNTFSSPGGEEHIFRRRRSAAVYTKSSIQMSPHVRKILSTVLQERYINVICESVRDGAELDILDLNFAYGLDVVSAFIFGIY